jgi:ABC-type Fe3+ transport system permease subunit
MVGHVALIGQIQSQAMSHAKFIFLIALVVFFVALFVAAYVWMRRPDFGQKGRRRDDARQGEAR